jgi:hypothetical protein
MTIGSEWMERQSRVQAPVKAVAALAVENGQGEPTARAVVQRTPRSAARGAARPQAGGDCFGARA